VGFGLVRGPVRCVLASKEHSKGLMRHVGGRSETLRQARVLAFLADQVIE